jgi:uncharacterized protein
LKENKIARIENMSLATIPARHGIATPLPKGSTIKVINTHGTQVVDTWAFTLSSFPPSPTSTIETQMSNQHTRACLNRTIPKVGDGLFNNKREKLLTVVEDTTGGIHDTLIAACDAERYLELAGEDGRGHRNCANNLVDGLGALGGLFLFWATVTLDERKELTMDDRYQSAAIHTFPAEFVHEYPGA